MFKRPSSRRKSKSEGVTLNLVPILDTMVTLIGFLLFTMSFLALSSIESMFPEVATKDLPDKIKERPLQLTLTIRPGESQIWSPFDRIPAKVIPNAPDGYPDTKVIHESLLAIKQRFPGETKIVLAPFAGASYDILIAAMDAVRMMEKSDPPLFVKNPATGNDEPVKSLFPEVVFGNLLGDT